MSPYGLAALIVGGRAWIFKLWGDAGLALREKDRFQNFVKSVKFGEAGGAENGD